jgi:hypothetical protein
MSGDTYLSEGEALLRRVCPGREFSPGEVEAANLVLSSFLGQGDKASRIPRRYIPLGESYEKDGKEYVCVEREEVASPKMACSGCVFSKSSSPDRWCLGLQCSRWDRADGRNVWFVEAEEGK